jgi:hypothetical protein
VENESVLAGLDQVGGNEIPSKGSGTRDNEGLISGCGGDEELAEHAEGLAKDVDEGGSDMGLAGGVLVIIIGN